MADRFALDTRSRAKMQSAQELPQRVECPTAPTSFNIASRQLLENAYESDRQKVDDLLLVVLTLCPFSFCAYNDANPNHGWTEYMEDGCVVQHLSWECLRDYVDGVLRIKLEKAQNLPSNPYGKCGRYIVFSAGSSREGSEDKWDDSNPLWNSTHCLFIKKNRHEGEHDSELHVELHNSERRKFKTEQQELFHKLKGKNCLGSASIGLKKVLKNKASTLNPCLKLKKGRPSGQDTIVRFNTRRISLEDAWKEVRKSTEPADAWEQQMPKSKKDCDWERLNKANIGGFKPVGFINAVKRGTQVWVYADHNAKTIAVAFRGTEKTKWEDVRTAFQILPLTLHWESTGSRNLETTFVPQTDEIKFHAGFIKAYNAVRIALLEIVYDITEWSEEWTICLTGHSLGGALAVLCSFDYVHLINTKENKPKVFMMSFGAPRVGNKAFKKTYEEKVKHAYRVAFGKDIVCSLPPHLHHVGRELRFDRSGIVFFNQKLLANVEAEAHLIDQKRTEETIRRWHSHIKRKSSMIRQATMRHRKMEDTSHAQDETPRKTFMRSDTSIKRGLEQAMAKATKRGTSNWSFLKVNSFRLDPVRLLKATKCISLAVPGLRDHSEKRYFRFANYVTRSLKHSRRYMHQNRHRSSEQFIHLLRLIGKQVAQQQDGKSADQNHEDQNE